jgi:hypothetical protein
MVIAYIPTNNIVVDRLIKPLEKTLFRRFKDIIGLVDKGITGTA